MLYHIKQTRIRSKRITLTAKEDLETDNIEQYRNSIIRQGGGVGTMVLFTFDTNEPYNPLPQP